EPGPVRCPCPPIGRLVPGELQELLSPGSRGRPTGRSAGLEGRMWDRDLRESGFPVSQDRRSGGGCERGKLPGRAAIAAPPGASPVRTDLYLLTTQSGY